MDKKIVMFCLCVLIVILVIPSVIFAASFDCSKARTKTEKAICGDPILSKLDEDMAAAYSKALKTSDRDAVKEGQRKWLKEILALCVEDKVCIKKAYENRLLQLKQVSGSMKRVQDPANPLAAQPGQMGDSRKPLKCPQCGIWQVGEVDILFIDDNRIVIPGCGVFVYKTNTSVSTPEGEDRHTYKISMLLTQKKTSFLCDTGDDKEWYLEAEVTGHFHEGGTADFILRKGKSAEPTLFLNGWNMDREDPCDAGSAYGSIACVSTEESLVYKGLSDGVAKAYELIMNIQVKKIPDFNAARFSATVDQFCTERERESGFGSWPRAYALGCKLGIVQKKY
jgi:uncharacterized protein YecT (DUF1311 family)